MDFSFLDSCWSLAKKERKDNLIQSLGPSTKMKKTLSYIQQHWCLAADLNIGIYNGEIIFNRLLRRCALSISDFQQCLGTFESKMPPYSHLQPQKSAKTVTWVIGNFFWPFSSTCWLNLWAKYSEPKKNRLFASFFLSELHELEVRICVQPKTPIIILILFNRFHKFSVSMGRNTSDNIFHFFSADCTVLPVIFHFHFHRLSRPTGNSSLSLSQIVPSYQ